MDSTPKDGPSPPLVCEEIADSELCASDAAMLSSGAKEDDADADTDAESCNYCDGAHGSGHRGYDSCVDDGGGRGEEEEEDGPPVSWWAWLAQNAACGTEAAGQEEEEEVASVKPVAGMEDRLFWETCLACGYP